VARTGADAIKLMGANCGDSRVLMIKDGQPPVQLTVDHVPDLESERQRIEDQKARNSKCVPERERERERSCVAAAGGHPQSLGTPSRAC
jgi:serine/threonine protein phosphatase PrpC